jgi:signal transduction histidine kinase/ligand-binding sensor domain-containing protein
MRATRFMLCVYVVTWFQLAWGQELPKAISFEHLTIPGTIRSSEVIDIIQDPEGIIWIAADGLFRYDGITFTRFTALPDGGYIGGREINSLFYDTVGRRLLMATRSQGVVEYNYGHNLLRQLFSRDGVPFINSLEQTADGKLWAVSFSNGLFILENDTLKKSTLKLAQRPFFTAPLALGEHLLIGHGPLVLFLKDHQVVDTLWLQWPNTTFNTYGMITALAYDGDGKLYIGTEKLGVLIYEVAQKKFIKYFPPEAFPFHNRINRIFTDQQGLVWILTKSGGLVVYSPQTDQYLSLTKNLLSPESLSGDNCTSIIQDKTGIIWVGSTGDLNKYDPNKVQFKHITHNPFNKNSLTDKMIRGVLEDGTGRLLIGTDGGYVNRLNLTTSEIDHIKVTLPGHTGVVVPMYFEHLDADYFLIGSSHGVLQMHNRTGVITPYAPLKSLLENKLVRQIIRHEDKLYLIANGRLYIHDLLTLKTEMFRNFSSHEAREVTNVTCIFLDSQQRLWLGVNPGISLLHPNHTFTHYEFEKSAIRPEGSYFMVLSIEEIEGKLWIGTFDSGVWLMDISNGTEKPAINKLPLPEYLANNTIYATLPDAAGNIWISTNQGISKLEPAQNKLTQFSISEGLQDREFNRLAHCKTSTGLLVFGGINGINIFDPLKINVKYDIPKPAILSVSCTRDEGNDFFIDLRNQQSLAFSAHQNFLTFTYLVPNYQQPARFETEYMLENHDVRWHTAMSNQASYTNLKPGQYTFKVRAKNSDGQEQISLVSMRINPPFWQTWWFIVLALVVLGLAVYGIVLVYTAKTIRDKERLEQLLSERTREIEQSHAELDKLNQKKDLIFSILSHDLRSPLTTLKGFLSLIIDNIDSMGREDIKKHASNIRTSVTSSLDLIDNTLFWSLSQTGSLTYTPTHFLLHNTLQKIHNLYLLTAEKKGIKIHVRVDDTLKVYADENMMYVTLRNIVANALKFTHSDKNVFIEAYRNHSYGVIRIKDEGVGMSQDYIDELIAEEPPVIKTGTANEKGTGLGLILCKKFINLNNGKLQITSRENEGTQFTVSLPLSDQP